MGKASKLSKLQQAVIEDMFSGECNEQAVLDKHGVGRSLFNKWMADAQFAQQFEEQIASAYRQSEIILARYAPLAAAKLVQLTESENQETARKACLDIIEREYRRQNTEWRKPSLTGDRRQNIDDVAGTGNEPTGQLQISDETASRILAVLAEASSAVD
jgi:hypothetical protein